MADRIYTRGALVEYALSIPPTVLVFDFNPKSISRTRSINIKTGDTPGTRGGADFWLPTETPRVSQGVTAQPESFTLDILFDASDRMGDDETIANTFGVEPELDTLRTMVEPKAQGPGGFQMMANLGFGGTRAFEKSQSASVLLFVWGSHVLPVFLTSVKVNEVAHKPNLVPYRANATLSLQVIEGGNPFWQVEQIRQLVGAALNTGRTAAEAIGGLF